MFALKSLLEIYDKSDDEELFGQFIDLALAQVIKNPLLSTNTLVARSTMGLLYEGAQMSVYSTLKTPDLLQNILEFVLWIIKQQLGYPPQRGLLDLSDLGFKTIVEITRYSKN